MFSVFIHLCFLGASLIHWLFENVLFNFQKFLESFANYSFKWSLCLSLFCDFHNAYSCVGPLMASHRSLRVCLSTLLFSFCPSDTVISITLSLTSLILASACLNLPLNPSCEFFFYFSHCTFKLKNLLLLFRFSLYRYFHAVRM